MSYFMWAPYVSVAEKRRRAEREVKKLQKSQKKGQPVEPVVIEGRKIAASFWGKAWCDNLERYSDYATRLPRGRSYVRNGAVVDLQLTKGEIVAKVSGSSLYNVKIKVEPAAKTRWKSICKDCTGSIDSLVELLQGRMSKSVMDRVCRQADGLFPAPKEMTLSCSCPDWAGMCKHVAATLYGVGARLDKKPQLLFALRGVDETELLAGVASDAALSKSVAANAKVLDDGDVAALFGLEMADDAGSEPAGTVVRSGSNLGTNNKHPGKSGRGKTASGKKAKAQKSTKRRRRLAAAKKGPVPAVVIAKKGGRSNKGAEARTVFPS